MSRKGALETCGAPADKRASKESDEPHLTSSENLLRGRHGEVLSLPSRHLLTHPLGIGGEQPYRTGGGRVGPRARAEAHGALVLLEPLRADMLAMAY